MTIILDGTTGITNDGGYTGDGVVFADTTPANTLVTTTGGNVGIGTSSPLAKFVVSNAGAQSIEFGYSAGLSANFMQSINRPGGADVDMVYYLAGSGAHRFYTNATERARISSSGTFDINGASGYGGINNNGKFGSLGTNVMFWLNTSTTSSRFASFEFNGNGGSGYIAPNGTSAVSYNTTSDYRLKEDVQPLSGALARIAALKPCTYKWKADGSDGEGFIAHELAEVVPQCVTGEKDAVDAEGKPQYQGIDTSFLVATLTAALQEAHGLIKDLQTRVAALEGTQP